MKEKVVVVVVADEVVGGIRGRGGNDHPMKMVMIIERIAIKIFLNLWTNYDDRGCERKTNEKKDNRVRFISKFINILFISLSQRVFFLHFIAFLTVCVLNLVTNKSILKTLKYAETLYIYLFILSRIKSTIIFFSSHLFPTFNLKI